MQSSRIKALVKEISREFNIPEKDIYAIVKAPFDLVVKVMREGSKEKVMFPSIRIISFGTFYMSKGRKEFFEKLNTKLNGREEELQSGADRPDNAGDKT